MGFVKMKFLLSLVFCSGLYSTCMPPVPMPEIYDSYYDCIHSGYVESIEKMEKIGPEEVNRSKTFIKFYCQPVKEGEST